VSGYIVFPIMAAEYEEDSLWTHLDVSLKHKLFRSGL